MAESISGIISLILPNETVQGDPYWAIMECREGQVTGHYWTVAAQDGEQIVPLFPVKDEATLLHFSLVNSESFVVRGISRRHLHFLKRRPPQGARLAEVKEISPDGELRMNLLVTEQQI